MIAVIVRYKRRIPPQPPDEWSASNRRALEAVVGVGSVRRPVHLPSVIARHPSFLPAYLDWAKAIALRGVLSPRHNGILALRTAYRCGSEFEWGVHARYALDRGSSEDEIAAVAQGEAAPLWGAIERALLRAVDELCDHAVIGDATWSELAACFDSAALLEIVFIVGHYTMLSLVANSAGVQPEPDWPAFPGSVQASP